MVHEYFHSEYITLQADISLKEITNIDVDKNSIGIQGDLWTMWKDPGLSLSDNSSRYLNVIAPHRPGIH